MKKRLRFFVSESFNDFGFSVRIGTEKDEHGYWDVCPPLMFNRVEPAMRIEPTFRAEKRELQALMDELWRVGIRPSNGEGNVGQIGATRHHLKDMRKIVGHYLKIKLDE